MTETEQQWYEAGRLAWARDSLSYGRPARGSRYNEVWDKGWTDAQIESERKP